MRRGSLGKMALNGSPVVFRNYNQSIPAINKSDGELADATTGLPQRSTRADPVASSNRTAKEIHRAVMSGDRSLKEHDSMHEETPTKQPLATLPARFRHHLWIFKRANGESF